MRRVVVVGGKGVFGAAAVDLLRGRGIEPVVASRREPAALRADVEDPASLRASLREGDVVVDAVGPFQERTPCLLECALETRFDVIDLSDSVAYALSVAALRERILAAGITVLTSCSSLSAVSAAVVRKSRIDRPVRISAFLAPASRVTASRGTGGSLLRSVGLPIRVLRDGQLVMRSGWRESRRFELPGHLGSRRGYLFESVDAVLLPGRWPSLRTVEAFAATGVPGMDWLFAWAARSAAARGALRRGQGVGVSVARALGSRAGLLAYEIEGASGETVRTALWATEGAHRMASLPAAMAAEALATGRLAGSGVVPPDRSVDSQSLWAELARLAISVFSERTPPRSSEAPGG